MSVFYNDNDSYAARWLENLAAAGLLPPGAADRRSILEVEPDDLRPFRQCHFFAGIGGWPLALELAGWPREREVWTASCPCQPLSGAGQRKGHADERHLWPAFYRLVALCRPATIFGEQVASKDGREWLAGVRADLEHLGYAVGAADLPAAGVGAPHIRQRLFWVAHSQERRGIDRYAGNGVARGSQAWSREFAERREPYSDGGMADAAGERERPDEPRRDRRESEFVDRPRVRSDGRDDGPARRLADADATGSGRFRRQGLSGNGHTSHRHNTDGCGAVGGLGDADHARPQGWRDRSDEHADQRAVWLPCLDGKARRVEPTIFPLAHAGEWGTGSRVGILRGAGNAIVAQAAAEFIAAFLDLEPEWL